MKRAPWLWTPTSAEPGMKVVRVMPLLAGSTMLSMAPVQQQRW